MNKSNRNTLPLHKRNKSQATHLSEELKSKYNIRSFPIRKGDTVKVMRGEYAGVEGKITQILREFDRLNIEGVTREKIAGGTVPIKVHTSKVMITELNTDDKWRQKTLSRRETRGK